ncbi:MAG: TM2 domain-containing protein [Clostridia bacterium]|nr:TM2 domain-containing protein [Clostridia bacterium]
MFCRNCGKEMEANAAYCVGCGVAAGQGNQFCPVCGAETHEQAVVCVKCGAGLRNSFGMVPGRKSRLVAGLLGIFLGGWGVHNFYLGNIGKAIAQIVLTFCFGIGAIWGLIEGIMILVGSINTDAQGNPLSD